MCLWKISLGFYIPCFVYTMPQKTRMMQLTEKLVFFVHVWVLQQNLASSDVLCLVVGSWISRSEYFCFHRCITQAGLQSLSSGVEVANGANACIQATFVISFYNAHQCAEVARTAIVMCTIFLQARWHIFMQRNAPFNHSVIGSSSMFLVHDEMCCCMTVVSSTLLRSFCY